MRVLLLTNSVGRIFDHLSDRLNWWLDALDDTVTASAADFVAIHLQRIGDDLDAINHFANAMRRRLPDFWTSGLFCPSPSDAQRDFTALGVVVFVRRSCTRDVAVFDFGAGDLGGWVPITTLSEPLALEPVLPARWSRHSGFSRDQFGAFDPQWMSKGWLHTRWRVDGQPLDLINIALFDDVDHLHALRRAGAMSSFAFCRHEALQHVMDVVRASGPVPVALGPIPPALLVAGDFNFRLDARSLLATVAGEAALGAELSRADAVSVRVPVLRAGSILTSTSPTRSGVWPWHSAIEGFFNAWSRFVAAIGLDSDQHITVTEDQFTMGDSAAEIFLRDPCAFRECDLELAACKKLLPALCELESVIAPTWKRKLRERTTDGPSLDESNAEVLCAPYDNDACPSWCDRVLLDEAAMRMVNRASDVVYGAHQHAPDAAVWNDHDLVHLAFTLGPRSLQADEAIGIRVKASAAAPVPIKVKYIAVGAG